MPICEIMSGMNRSEVAKISDQFFHEKTLPSELLLPSESLGALGESVIQSDGDGLERSQMIKWDRRKGFSYSKVYIGKSTSIGQEALINWQRQDLFKLNKPFLVWHTHPTGISQFSEEDITCILAMPRLAHIHLVGSTNGVAAVVPVRFPRYILDKPFYQMHIMHLLTQTRYRDTVMQGLRTGDYTKTADILGNFGLQYYRWDSKIRNGKQDLVNGIQLIVPQFPQTT